MRLFDFFKPRRDPLRYLEKQPNIRKAMLAQELEFAQKQIANLRAVGRDAEAGKLVADSREKIGEFFRLTFREWDKLPLLRPSPEQMAKVSYRIAYYVLPESVHGEFDKFLGIWRTMVPPIGIMLCEYACSLQKVRPTPEFATAFQTHEGRLDSNRDYYVLQFPPAPAPAPMPPREMLLEDITKAREKMPVLAPYFAAIVNDRSSCDRAYYVLGQSLATGTTLRSVTADGTNGNLGPGPEPTVASFVRCLMNRPVR